jgi:signal transduction histidine kinase
MRRPRPPAGLRWRLLLALVLTSAVTLGVAAVVVLEPLQQDLHDQSAENLRGTVVSAVPEIQNALGSKPPERAAATSERAFDLRYQTDARVLVGNTALLPENGPPPGFLTDTDPFSDRRQPVLVAVRAMNRGETVTDLQGDSLAVAVPLYGGEGMIGVVVAQRRDTEVTTLVGQVRNAFLAAAGVGLLVAVLLSAALSGTLLRRLGRLRAAALRMTEAGPDAPPMPHDERRDEVGDLARALARMQEELRRQETARRAFVSTASHELRTPLTMLQGTMELLQEDLAGREVDLADAQLQVATARRELGRLSALAGELLDLSRLDAAVPLRSEPVELGELVRAVAAEFTLRARERDVTLDVVPPRGPCWGRGDPDAAARVVRILLDNALRYGPPGESVRLATLAGDAHVTVSVADRGPGVPAAERERIFERFHRGSAAGSEGGFGLGLAIGRELAVRMGGDLRLVDRDEPGACFVLSLRPARRPAARDAERPRAAPPREPAATRS